MPPPPPPPEVDAEDALLKRRTRTYARRCPPPYSLSFDGTPALCTDRLDRRPPSVIRQPPGVTPVAQWSEEGEGMRCFWLWRSVPLSRTPTLRHVTRRAARLFGDVHSKGVVLPVRCVLSARAPPRTYLFGTAKGQRPLQR